MSLLVSIAVTGEGYAPVHNFYQTQLSQTANGHDGLTRLDYGKMPMLFEQNAGQTDRAVKFVSRGPGYTLYLTDSGADFSLKIRDEENNELLSKFDGANVRTKTDTLKMRFAGSNPDAVVSGGDQAVTKTNYYIGKKRIENLSNYRRVNYERLYKGIDAVFYGNAANQLEYDFVVAPGSDPNQIRLTFDAAKSIEVDATGRLVIKTESTQLVKQKPIAYQTINGEKRIVQVGYAVTGNGVTFTLGEYDRTQPLTIDPALDYLTYIGGTAFDDSFEIAADAQLNAYITGTTQSLDFHGETRGVRVGSGVYAAKINADGTAFVYITILEGSGDDSGRGIALDGSNNVYLSGVASRDFPTTSGAFDTVHGALNDFDAFVAKLNAGGNVVYASYLGGTAQDEGFDVAVDSTGKAFVVGATFSSTAFPKKNEFQGCGIPVPGSTNSLDAFLTVFNSAGSDITYSTCIGAGGFQSEGFEDLAFGVAIDSSNNAYLTGSTGGRGTFPTKNAAQPTEGGGVDAWVAKFNPAQSGDASLVYSTYLGGSGTDRGVSIAVSATGVAAVTGITGSANFPLLNAFDSTNQINEGFVAQYGATGAKLNASFLGGADQDQGTSIALGNGGTIYVTGDTLSNNFPTATPFQAARRGVRDAFIAKVRFGINSNPGVSSASYLGGNGNDKGNGIAVRGNFIFVSGETQSSNLLTTAGVIKPTSAADATNPDGFVAKILDTRKDTIGTFDPVDTRFDLRNTLTSGPADITVNRGIVGDVPVAGDFNGDGIDTASTFNNGVWKINNANVTVSGYPTSPFTVNFGQAGDLPVVGDWNNDGIDTVGVYRPSIGDFFVTNSAANVTNPPIDVQIDFGIAEDLPVAGDWDADGVDSVGVFRPSGGLFFLTNDNVVNPNIDITAFFGTSGDLPVAGDWDGNGPDTIGVWRPSSLEFFLSNDNNTISNQFVFGASNHQPVAGDWDGKPL
ncbi:MAG TPA: SBBP repeat-containing protein [Pyrinomonadaceae bacterium]|nr:SBBP repeat-containing protein [Pyrinomonadaceae bacterium]